MVMGLTEILEGDGSDELMSPLGVALSHAQSYLSDQFRDRNTTVGMSQRYQHRCDLTLHNFFTVCPPSIYEVLNSTCSFAII
jgi:hypothetical protein